MIESKNGQLDTARYKSMKDWSTVTIVQRRLTHYRIPLFEMLRSELYKRGITLELLIGQGTFSELQKNDSGSLEWAKHVPTKYFLGGRFCWQPLYRYVKQTSLVIVTQENKLLANHLFMLFPRKFKLAFWGHGANLQGNNPNGFKERFKRLTVNYVDWWFAYTRKTFNVVSAAGFPADRITVLNNSVDTREYCRFKKSITPEEISELRQSLGFRDGPVGVYIGSLYSDKRLDFLYDSVLVIRKKIPNFNLLVIGDGPERSKVEAWTSSNTWVKWVGARFDREKILYISMAELILSPGAVGLGMLDSFICGVPLLTTNCMNHGPEIAYLESGKNGLMTENTINDYTTAAVKLLQDNDALNVLRAGCAKSVQEYTLENMVFRFAEGIEHALGNRTVGTNHAD